MPTIPEPFVRTDYRGLNDAEDSLLRAFLQDQDLEIQSLETQIRVGPGEQLPEYQPESFRRSWQESSKFKIDAAVELPGEIRLVELKDFIRTSHLGQLLSYRYWFGVERSPDKPVSLTVTAPDINPSAVQPTRFHGVSLHLQSQQGQRHLQQGLDAAPPF